MPLASFIYGHFLNSTGIYSFKSQCFRTSLISYVTSVLTYNSGSNCEQHRDLIIFNDLQTYNWNKPQLLFSNGNKHKHLSLKTI